MTTSRNLGLAWSIAAMLVFPACSINVQEENEGKNANVDIRTPIGNLSVRAGGTADTGLPVYPGARPAQSKDRRNESANVDIGAAGFGVKVAAASFEGNDSPQRVLDFYRNEMKTYGEVTECRGNIDFKGSRRPVCKERPGDDEVQLVVGIEEEHRLVSVKPRGTGSEFAVVYVRTGSS